MSDWEHNNFGTDGNKDWMDWTNGSIEGDEKDRELAQLAKVLSPLTEFATPHTATATPNDGSKDFGIAEAWTESFYVSPFLPSTAITDTFASSTSNGGSSFNVGIQGGSFGAVIVDDIPEAAYVPPVPPWMSSRIARDNTSKEQEKFLVRLRQDGVGFEEISVQMKAKFGLEVSANALVKRYQKALDAYLLPVAEATKSAMPDIMGVIMRELGKRMDVSQLSEADKKVLEGLQQDLPRIVQNRVLRKRKTMLSTDE